MKGTKGFKRIAVVAAAGMLFSSVLTVSAATGSTKVTGTGTTSVNTSTGTINSTPDAELTNGESTIDVQAKVSGGNEIVYDLDITWGAMQFEYDYGSQWNPATHSYTAGTSGAQDGGWVTTGYVDATNNKITVVNNSNFPMKADFSSEVTGLNANATDSGSVVGIFANNNTALTAAVLAEGYNGASTNSMTTIAASMEMYTKSLTSGQNYYYKTKDDAAKADAEADAAAAKSEIYFALSGKPDVGGPQTFSSVGTITINIAPETDVQRGTK
ncbi:MAG: hypothetical protein J6N76_03865 [Lachnospiraceae bacterium]|nr:hypothetical protein [Lachnospiraceae bacterium]